MGSTHLKLGDWNTICDRCGQKRKASELKEDRQKPGLMVCADTCWDPRHPNDFFKLPPEDTSVPWTRPEASDRGGTDINGNSTIFISGPTTVTGNQTLTVGTDSTIQVWEADLTSNVTVTLDTTGASRGDRFQIYRKGGGAYTFDIGGLKTSLANIKFYAEVEYNGTAWTLISYTPLGL